MDHPVSGGRAPGGGSRKAPRPRRLPGAVARTVAATLLPALVLGLVGWFALRPRAGDLVALAVDPTALVGLLVGLVVVWLLWVVGIGVTWSRSRPAALGRGGRLAGVVGVLALSLLVTAPMAQAGHYVLVQRDLITTVFDDEESATTPEEVTEADPWGGQRRVNVLLLGGDGAVHRDGVRTDSMILASIDVRTGRAVTFSLPRNLRDVPFPASSPLHDLYPDGFYLPDDPEAESMLNAVYRNVPALHPGVLGDSDNEGADAVKQAVSGALGLRVDYYLLVNLDGFRQIVDAIGGITVNVNVPVAIGGNKDAGIPPEDYLEPGPDRRLDGFEALWFARGRWGANDYQRMERQRCALSAIVDEADAVTLLRRYTDLARASKKILRTDVPQDLLPAFVELSGRMKGQSIRSVVFEYSDAFDPNDPDFGVVRQAVRAAMRGERAASGPAATPTPSADPSASPTDGPTEEPTDEPSAPETETAAPSAETADACAYDPDEDFVYSQDGDQAYSSSD